MGSNSPSPPITTDASNPSIVERVVRHKWEGAKYGRADGDFSQWTERLKDALILNGIYGYVFVDRGAQHCFADLKTRAQREGPIKQISLLQEALSTYCSLSEPLPTTAGRIVDIVKRAFDIGPIELFMNIALLNSLNDPSFEALQNSVSTLLSSATKEKPCTPLDIRLLMENAQNIINSKSSPSTAMLVKGGAANKSREHSDHIPGHNHSPGATCCENCHSLGRACKGHLKNYCVQKGGGMAGKSISEARAAAKAGSKEKSNTTPTFNAKTYVAVTGLGGKLWYVDQSQLGQPPSPATMEPSAFAGIGTTNIINPAHDHTTEYWEHAGFIATAIEDPRATVDWHKNTKPNED